MRDCKGSEESKVLCTQVFVTEPMLASLGSFNYRRIISRVLDLHSAGYIIQERECTAGICLEIEVDLQLFTDTIDTKAAFPQKTKYCI